MTTPMANIDVSPHRRHDSTDLPDAGPTPSTEGDVAPIRVAQLLVGFRSDGGAEQLVRTLIDEMTTMPCTASVFTLNPVRGEIAADLERRESDLTTLPARRLVNPLRFVRLLRALRRGEFDVIHTHLTAANILGVLAGRILRIPTVVTLHSTVSTSDDHWYHGRLERLVLGRLADVIVAVGEETAVTQGERLGRDDLVVMPNAIASAPEIDDERRTTLRREVMNDPERSMVLAVGRLEPAKGYPDLIDAFADVVTGHDAELVIVGRGSLHDELDDRIGQADLRDRARIVGVRDDVRDLMQACDLFVMSSHWEGLPMVLLEAMASDVPVVGTDVGDIAAVLADTPSRIVEPGRPEQLATAIGDTLDLAADGVDLTSAGRAVVCDRFSSRTWAAATTDLYRRVVADTRGTRRRRTRA